MPTPPRPSAEPDRQIIALFNYGGGMRGLIPAHIMVRIEDITGLRMTDMVDIFSGPSTGAILNAAMTLRHPDEPSQPKFRARHMVRFYEREGINIFPPDNFREFRGLLHDMNNRTVKLDRINALFRNGHYDTSHLSAALRALFGEAKLKDSLRSLIIPAYNIDGQLNMAPGSLLDPGGSALWLKHIRTGTPPDCEHQTIDVRLYDAVMASCAAPTYFPCHPFSMRIPGEMEERQVSAIDGCVFDNPCASYFGAIREHIPAGHKVNMIVLGTGDTNKSIRREAWNRYGALGVVDPANDLPLINIFFSAAESALADAFRTEMDGRLYTLNRSMNGHDPLLPSAQIDDASPENLKKMRLFAESIIEEQGGRFDELCHLLVGNRDRKEKENTRKNRKTRIRKFFTFFSSGDETQRLENR